MSERGSFKEVTRQDPCPVCESDHWCMVALDGATALCNRIDHGSRGTTKGGAYIHRLHDRDDDYIPPVRQSKPKRASAIPFDVDRARAVYRFVAAHAHANLTDEARTELARRFGPLYAAQVAERFGIGHCDPRSLPDALAAAGLHDDAIMAGVLNRSGRVVSALSSRLVIPYRRGGQVCDLRGSGIKARGDKTAELSLPGGYEERHVDGLFFNHDDLDALQPGETIHVAGGAWKTIALALSGLRAIGRRGEGELSDTQLAAIVAAGPGEVILHIDAEDPKDGNNLSAGRRLGLRVAERMALAGLHVKVAEPPREPGTPKVDPDALLRDFGPAMVRAYALSAPTLEAWRVVIGVESPGVPEAVAKQVDALQDRLGEMERRHQRLTDEWSAVSEFLGNEHLNPADRIVFYKLASEYGSFRQAGQDEDGRVVVRIGETDRAARRRVAAELGAEAAEQASGFGLARKCGLDAKTVGKTVKKFAEWGIIAREERRGRTEDGKPRSDILIRMSADHAADILREKADFAPEVARNHGGKREPCPRCHSTRRLTVVSCPDCGLELSRKVDDGESADVPPTPIEDLAEGLIPQADAAEVGTKTGTDFDSEPADDWDPFECNHPGCVRPVVVGRRYCGDHRHLGLDPEQSAGGPRADDGRASLDRDIIQAIAARHDAAAIAERLARLREEGDAGLIAQWEAIAAARSRIDARLTARR